MTGSWRLGVLDVGSNTVHLLVVDAHRGARPRRCVGEDRAAARRADRRAGRLTGEGLARWSTPSPGPAAPAATRVAIEVLAFATSALRDATNSAAVTARVRAETGVELRLLPGEDEARYTFLAARRWCGWSAGRLLVLDIGGGSLELAAGDDEDPDVAVSVPLGAGRTTRDGSATTHRSAPRSRHWRRTPPRCSPRSPGQLRGEGAGSVRRHVEDVPLAGPADRGRRRRS